MNDFFEDDNEGGIPDEELVHELDDRCKCGHAFELHYDDGNGCCLVSNCNCEKFSHKD